MWEVRNQVSNEKRDWQYLARYSLEIRKQGFSQQDSFGFHSKSEETYMLFSFLEQLNREPFEITNILKWEDFRWKDLNDFLLEK